MRGPAGMTRLEGGPPSCGERMNRLTIIVVAFLLKLRKNVDKRTDNARVESFTCLPFKNSDRRFE